MRLDQLVQSQMTELTRNQIAGLIMQGKVTVNGTVTTKAGALVDTQALITCDTQTQRYVSRAGFKLERAVEYFALDLTGKVALDAGLSTGGFTDCLLQNGITHVYGIDVGYGQVHEKIRDDKRVTVIERTNLRYVTELPQPIDIATLDLSFISVTKVMPALINLMVPHAELVVLIKPQFEARKEQVGRGGVIRDAKIHQEVIASIVPALCAFGFINIGVIESPIEGATGNKEFLAYFKRQ